MTWTFTIRRERFADALTLAAAVAVPERHNNPLLRNVRMAGDEGGGAITLAATNLQLGLWQRMEVMGTPAGATAACFPADRLAKLANADMSELWELSVDGKYKLSIRTERGTVALTGAPAEDFPDVSPEAKAGSGDAREVSGDALAAALARTAFCAAKGDTRYALSGVFMRFGAAGAELVASDTHRMSRSCLAAPGATRDSGATDGIVITAGAQLLGRLAAGRERVGLRLSPAWLSADMGDRFMTARLVDGTFPRFEQVIPAAEKAVARVTVEREELLHLLKLGGQVANPETRTVSLIPRDGTLALTTDGGDGNAAQLALAAEIEGEAPEQMFNHVFLMDALKSFPDERLTLLFSANDAPLRIDSGDYTHIVVPLRRY